MKKVGLRTREISKLLAIIITVMIVVSAVAIIQVGIPGRTETVIDGNSIYPSYQIRPCQLTTNNSLPIPWVHFDTTDPGTPSEVHETVSDTTGITIVADFHGFWRSNYTNGTILYDDLIMPGASSMKEPGIPMLPVLTELIEIPHDIDVSIEFLSLSNDTGSNYDIRPVPETYYPVGIGEDISSNASTSQILPDVLSPNYNQNVSFPGLSATTTGESGATPIIIRDHRLLELSFYPIQYNPRTRNITAFSQIVVKLKYSEPAQIRPIRESLRSEIFERVLKNSVLNYDEVHSRYQRDGSYHRWLPIYSEPNATIPQYLLSQEPQGKIMGAEYLIITNDTFKAQAQRLVDWKQRKGITAKVLTINWDMGVSREEMIKNIQDEIVFVYENWFPVPSYVVLFGDVETIPTITGMEHPGYYKTGVRFFPEGGHFATDLYYFTLQGNSFYPDIIYSRMSVDTIEQAEIIVNRTIMYEQAPQVEDRFYENILQSGYFQDAEPYREGTEDRGAPFIYHLENIRHYLKNLYDVNINYSSAVGKQDPIKFRLPVGDASDSSDLVEHFLEDYEWLYSYDVDIHREDAARNITANINDGRFLVMYYGHGGSKNMKYSVFVNFSSDNRDIVEGWHSPWFNISDFHLLNNGNMTPLVLSITCSSGWFDGETDQEYCTLTYSERHISGDIFETYDLNGNAFEMYDGESFAENLTRLAGGGAIVVIAPSRPVPSLISGEMLNAMIQAFWPGYKESRSQAIYEIGGAFYTARLDAAEGYVDIYSERDIAQQMYEGFHLFGDPETQLWTDVPSEFNITYPTTIGSQVQRFVVTVNNSKNDEPVSNAKVCIQQGTDIYQVGYTDGNGQVIFNVNPGDRLGSINVTVTKHNYKPHLGEILVEKSDQAPLTVTVEPETALAGDEIEIKITGFDRGIVTLHFGDTDFDMQETSLKTVVPAGFVGYVNVIAEQGNLIATTSFYRLSSDKNPDPYIYSQYDDSTWELAEDDEPVWDNPSIDIYYDGILVDHLQLNQEYDVNVTVWNRGDGDAIGTQVTLWYAQFGGGVSWREVEPEPKIVDIPLFESREVSFKWTPSLPDTACLNVSIWVLGELTEDKINNMGVEVWHVFPLCSPGESEEFVIGNPSEDDDYVSITVRQEGDEDDVWSARIEDYDSKSLGTDDIDDDVTLVVDPNHDLHRDESRSFTAEMYVDDELILGIQFDGTCTNPIFYVIIILIVMLVVFVIVAYFASSNRNRFVEILIILGLLGVVTLEILLLLDWINVVDLIPLIGEGGG